MKLITATLATAALLALAGTVPAAHAQDQQQQDKQHPPKQQKPSHPRQEQKPAHPQEQQRPAHPQQQQQRPQQEQRQQQTQQRQQQREQQTQQKEQQREQRTQQKQQQDQQKQQRQEQQRQSQQAQKREQQQERQNASRPQQQREQRAQENPGDRGGRQHARGNPQQQVHYEQAHLHRYQPQHNERVVRIDEVQFREHFGREHFFHIGRPVIIGGFPRFAFSGFTFVLEEPWPDYWYDGDNLYIVDDDGVYYLCNEDDPGVEVELAVIVG